MDNQSYVGADSHRPEIPVPGFGKLVKLHSGAGRIDLQIEGGRLDALLLVTGQPGEAVATPG